MGTAKDSAERRRCPWPGESGAEDSKHVELHNFAARKREARRAAQLALASEREALHVRIGAASSGDRLDCIGCVVGDYIGVAGARAKEPAGEEGAAGGKDAAGGRGRGGGAGKRHHIDYVKIPIASARFWTVRWLL